MDLEAPHQPECTVSGVMRFILHVSQIAAIAPIKFERVRNSWRVKLSRFYFCYDLLVVIIIRVQGKLNDLMHYGVQTNFAINNNIFSALSYLMTREDVIDGYESSSNTGFMRIVTKLLLFIQCVVGTTVVATGYDRLRHMIHAIARLQQINEELDRIFRPLPTSEIKTWCMVIFLIIFGYFGCFMEYVMYMYDVMESNDSVPFKSCAFVAVYIYLVHLQLFPIQFSLVAMRLVSTQERLNSSLKSVLDDMYNNYSKTDPKMLSQLLNIYCSLCNIIGQLNESNGVPIILVLLFTLRNLITTPYFMVSILYRQHAVFPLTKALCSLGWSCVCLSMMILNTEPCHRAHDQLFLTKDLVYQMIRHTSREASAMNYELKMFRRHILLNTDKFCPLQLMILDRYVLLAVLNKMDLEIPLEPECTVSGVMSFVLHISRVAGIAPIKLERVRKGWRINVSRFHLVYDLLVVITLDIFAGFYYFNSELTVDGYQFSTNTGFMRVIKLLVPIVQYVVGITVVYTGYNRFRHMIYTITQLEQINNEFDRLFRPLPTADETKIWIIIILVIIHGYVGSFLEYVIYLYDVIVANDTVPFSSYAFGAVYIHINILLLFPIQFFLVTMRLESTQKRLNSYLKSLLQEIYSSVLPIPQNEKIDKENRNTLLHQINHITNWHLSLIVKTGHKPEPKMLNKLTNIYCSLCDIMRQLNESHGIPLVMLLLYTVRNLVTAPYFTASIFRNYATFPMLKSLSTVGWATVCFSMLLMAVEPCHRVHNQLRLTKELVHKMISHTPQEASAFHYELKMFKRHIQLNTVGFSPMQLVKFDRHVIIAVLTTTITYLSVVINL